MRTPTFNKFFVFCITSLLLFSCKKQEIISGNVAPPDSTVEDITIGNYVNRVYITVVGHQPDAAQKAAGYNLLRNANLSAASRLQFLDSVFAQPAYQAHLFDLARVELLNSTDTSEITYDLILLDTLLTISTYQLLWDQIRYEIVRLDTLQRTYNDLQNHVIDLGYLNRRFVNNYIYDQLNMGTENFVISCFQHFLNRYPSGSELAGAKTIVDGISPGNLFLQTGQGKPDFLTIFFNSTNYKEGLVLNLYQRLLLRAPTSIEMGDATQKYNQTHDYEQMQKDILSTNEYIGIKK